MRPPSGRSESPKKIKFPGESKKICDCLQRVVDAAGETVACVARGNQITFPVMRQSASKRKKLDYPQETEGSRLAAKVRKLASKLTPEEEAEHFRQFPDLGGQTA